MRFFLLLLFIPTILCQQNYQTFPLRFDTALNRIKTYQHYNPKDLLDEVSTYSFSHNDILSLSENATTQCERDFELLIHAVTKREMWALKVIDAWGKPLPSGILKGNLFWIGSYDECIQAYYNPGNKSFISQPFETQHCTLYPSSASAQPFGGPTGILLGLCVPSSCNKQDIISLIHKYFKKTNDTESNLICSNDPPNGQKGLTHGAIATIVILSILGLVVLIGTIVDLVLTSKTDSVTDITSHINGYNHLIDTGIGDHVLIKSSKNSHALIKSTPQTVFLAEFSAIKSLRRIFTMKQKTDHESFPFINGIRVLSLFWVIIGHSLLFGISFSSNTLDVLVWSRHVSFQLIINAVFSVDTFFFLSGFLTATLFIRQVTKEGKVSLRTMILYYIHRYIRLTPTFLLVVMISINLTPYFGSGPAFPAREGFESPQCRSTYWWTSILYVGNIVKPDNMCLVISWYLHNDMQFHWIAPLALVPFALGKKAIGIIVSILFILVGIGSIAGLLIYYPELQASQMGGGGTNATGPNFFDDIYVTPWCRLSAYFVGVLIGFLIINTDRSIRINKRIKILGSIASVIIALACLFAIYPDEILVPGIDRTSFIIYQSLSRTLWCLAIGWLFFLCMTNQGGIINKILSWPIWAPLARLNYATYLIHSTVILIIVTNLRIPFYYQPHIVVNNFVSQIFFSYLTGIVVVIFIETPFFVIEKKLFKR